MRASELLINSAWLPIVDSIAKTTLLFATAGLTCWILRRASAAARHLVWTLALAAALMLPVLSIALPRWQLPIVTVASSDGVPAAVPTSFSTSPPLTASETYVAPRGSAASQPPAEPASAYAERVSAAGLPPPPRLPRSAEASREGAKLGGTYVLVLSWPVALAFIGAFGMAAILLRVVVGIVAVQWMARRSALVTDAPWLPLARHLAASLGVSPRVRFLRSDRATMPMAVGIFTPAVLMPAEADEWPPERLRIVLLHELAHVKRRDCLTHVVAQIACAFHWFNPLAWIAARRVRTERERACDDLVLAAGTHGPDYADQLLEIARVMRAGRFPAVLASASLAMAHRSQLEGRLIAILDPTVPRSGVSRVRTSIAAAAAIVTLVPLASLQPWAHASEPAPAPAHTAAAAPQNVPPPAPAPIPAPAPSPAPSKPPVEDTRDPRDGGLPAAIAGAVRDGVADGVSQSVVDSVLDSMRGAVQVAAPEIAVVVESAVAGALQDAAPKVAGESQTGRKADPRTIAALTAALKDTDKGVRETALHALVQLRDPSVFEPLIQALTDASAELREQAAAGLGQLRDRRALEPLVAAMKDQSGEVREQVAFALGQLRDRVAVPALVAALKDSDPDVREQVVFALGQLRDPSTLEGLAAALSDERANVREQAAFALGQLRDRRAVEPLISALKDAAPDVREQVAFALGQIREKAAVEALIFALRDASADVREQVVFALGQLRDPRAIDALTAALKDASASVRRQAAFALGQLIR